MENTQKIEITKNLDGNTLVLGLKGRLDTTSAPELEQILNGSLGGVEILVLDLEALIYLSSAGLRVLLSAQKKMNMQGKMLVRNVCKDVLEVFEITGFTDILTIE